MAVRFGSRRGAGSGVLGRGDVAGEVGVAVQVVDGSG
jgi:hypothetical protein